jgi:hypothetical protein
LTGAPGPLTMPTVASSKWRPDDPRWARASKDLRFELELFERGKLDGGQAQRVRRALAGAVSDGVITPDAADNARRLAMMTWEIVAIRFDRREPIYPKNHDLPSLRRHAQAVAQWDQELAAEVRRQCTAGLRGLRIRDGVLADLPDVLRRGRGPARTGLSVAHTVYGFLSARTTLELNPAASAKLTPALERLLVVVAAKYFARKQLPTKRLTR